VVAPATWLLEYTEVPSKETWMLVEGPLAVTGKPTKPSWMQIDWVRVYK
jgi:hypothetical protein